MPKAEFGETFAKMTSISTWCNSQNMSKRFKVAKNGRENLKCIIFIIIIFFGCAIFFVRTYSIRHPVESENENNGGVQSRTLPFIRKTIKQHRKRLFQAGENLIETSKMAVSGLGSLVTGGDFQGPFLCAGCKAAVEALRFQVKSGREEDIYSMIESTCTLLNIQTKNVCHGIAHLFGPELVPILNTTLDGLYICSFLLTHDCTKVELPQWEITLPPISNLSRKALALPSNNGPKLKVLHLTDTHYDRSYAEGAKVNCGEPLCCRIQNGFASKREKGAGKWGDWNCDIPERTLDSMLENAAKIHPDIDYIIWTGDIPAHDIWNQSKQANLEILRSTSAKIKQYFPRVPVYPAVGNHESAPTDNFPYPGAIKSASWLYDELEKEWSNWLPNSTSDTIKRGAFYTTLIAPKFRIISLNTNYCYHRNWWLMINSTDPAGQLEWLVHVLKRAEEENEKVHIIAHIPPGQRDCLPEWRDNYYRIVSRFRNTVVNHFFGHTHKDEFEIYYDEEEVEPVGVGYIGPSVTTYTSLNPGYRIYYIDGDSDNSSRMVIDYENWVLDLDYTNKNDEPKWNKSYSAIEEYQMTSLTPKDWHKFYNKLKSDDQLFQLYYKHSNKDSPQILNKPCNANCKKTILCNIRSCDKYD